MASENGPGKPRVVRHDTAALRERFEAADLDHDGHLTRAEFNALRAEMKRVDQQQKDFRKDKRSANNSIAARDYWKQPLDHGQVNKKE